MSKKNDAKFSELFIKHEIIKLKLIADSIERPNEKFPTAREIAKNNNVSELTVKKVEKELAQKGYLVSNKKGGTRSVSKFAKEQVSAYLSVKESFKGLVDTLIKNGFSKEDVMALVYSVLSNVSDEVSSVIYTEKDEGVAVFAKREIEEKIKSQVVFRPFETLKTELKNKIIKNKIIIVPFFCYSQLEAFSYEGVKIIPVRARHPLEGFSEIDSMPLYSRVFYIAASRMDKENANEIYSEVLKKKFRIYIYTQDDLASNRHLLNFADVVIGYKWIIENNSYLFRDVKKVIKKDRFDDDEGMEIIEYYLKNNDGLEGSL